MWLLTIIILQPPSMAAPRAKTLVTVRILAPTTAAEKNWHAAPLSRRREVRVVEDEQVVTLRILDHE